MLFYALLLLASFIVSCAILWAMRIIAENSNAHSTHHVSIPAEKKTLRHRVKRYANTRKKRAAIRKRGKTVKPAITPGWNLNSSAGNTARNKKLSGQAYKPSDQAVSAFALKVSDD